MRMYLKNNDELKSSMTKSATGCNQLAGHYVMNIGGCPYIDILEDFELLNNIKVLPGLFIKATIVGAVNYSTLREHGFYTYGKASARLTSKGKDYWYINGETSSWEGIADMKILQDKIQAGTIIPSLSYEKPQIKNHLLCVLKQILDSRNLSKMQRFFLALRLTKQ